MPESSPRLHSLFSSQALQSVGGQCSALAMGVLSVLVLHAGPAEVGILGALGFLPNFVAPLAGTLIDRQPPRRLLTAAFALRALCLGSLPVAFALHQLRIEQLYLISLLVGSCSLLSDLSSQSYLPRLVGRSRVLKVNAQLGLIGGGGQLAGPAAAGVIVQILGGALGMLVETATALLSACLYRSLPALPPALHVETEQGYWAQLKEGFVGLWRTGWLRALGLCTGLSNLGLFAAQAVLTVFAYRQLHLTPAQMGVAGTIAGTGALLGAVLVRPAGRWPGSRSLAALGALSAAGIGLQALAAVAYPFWLFAVGGALAAAGMGAYGTCSVSLRQALLPPDVLGRYNSGLRLLILGSIPPAQLGGGALAQLIGPLPVILGGAAVAILAALITLFEPGLGTARPLTESRSIAKAA